MVSKFMERAANRDYSKPWAKEGTIPAIFQSAKPPIEGRPHPVIDNYIRTVKGEKPWWMPVWTYEASIVWPDALEEHPVPEVEGLDWWGILWKDVPNAGALMPISGSGTVTDFENWKEEVVWPDLSEVDFKADGIKIQKNLDPDRPHIYACTEGLFERLHDLIPFDDALLTFYDDPELLEEFFERMADYKIECCKKVFENYGRIDGVLYYDDWGTERAGFFSNDMFREQIMPQTKRVFDYIKEQGKFIELHSCGRNMQYVPMMIEMGVDMWSPQARANDMDFLYDTYGEQMTWTIPLDLSQIHDAEKAVESVHRFVDRYGETGRVLADIISPDAEILALAREELFRYSYDKYNKMYGRTT